MAPSYGVSPTSGGTRPECTAVLLPASVAEGARVAGGCVCATGEWLMSGGTVASCTTTCSSTDSGLARALLSRSLPQITAAAHNKSPSAIQRSVRGAALAAVAAVAGGKVAKIFSFCAARKEAGPLDPLFFAPNFKNGDDAAAESVGGAPHHRADAMPAHAQRAKGATRASQVCH